MEGLVWSKIYHPAVQPNPAPASIAEPLFQVSEVTTRNNSDEVMDYSIIINQTTVEKNSERKSKLKTPFVLKEKKDFGIVYDGISHKFWWENLFGEADFRTLRTQALNIFPHYF